MPAFPMTDSATISPAASALPTLPDDVLPSVLQYFPSKHLLTSCMLVNKAWYSAVCGNETVWQHQTLNIPSSIAHHRPRPLIDTEILNWMGKHAHTSLYGLSIHTQISLSFIMRLVEEYKQLQTVRISSPPNVCDLRDSALVDDDVFWLSHLQQLTSIDLDAAWNLTDDSLKYLASCHHLQSLTLRSPSQLTDKSLESIGQMKHLTTLQLLLTSAGLDNSRWSDDGWQHLSGLKQLQTLAVWNCQSSDKWLFWLGKLTTLTSLDLDNCEQSSSDAYRHLVSLTKLKSLSLCRTRLEDNALQWIGWLSGLESLRISFCHKLTDFGITMLANGLRELRQLNLLKCVNLTDASIKVIASKLKDLQSIDLSGCLLLTDLSLQHLRQCSNLRSVHLSGCVELTAEAVTKLKADMPQLQKLQHRTLASHTRRHLEARVHAPE